LADCSLVYFNPNGSLLLSSWDMSKFLNIQCRVSRIRYPPFAKKWINIRKSYGNFYKVRLGDRYSC
jgi:inhibitor of KinA sporulation pathway (predicted exonuclease)